MRYASRSSALGSATRRRLVAILGVGLVVLAAGSPNEALAATPVTSPIRTAQLYSTDGRWASVAPRSADDERAEIRAHFVAVRRILWHDTPISLAVAVARFERAFDLSLSPESRAALHDQLAARRAAQLERLQDYARAGSFPLNRHYEGEARPIFVDAQGTHCAVGHLMALDGWEAEVNAMARATPNVLVREVDDGPLVVWLLTSGLTQEEAALIQPGYSPPPASISTTFSTLIVPGASLDFNGYRYENFAFSASSTGGAATPGAEQFGLVYGWPPVATGSPSFCTGFSPTCIPRPDTLWFGAYISPTSFGYLGAGANQSITFNIDYDVVAMAAGLAIGGTETFTSEYFGGFMGYPGTASISTTLDDGVLGTLVLDYPPFASDNTGSILLATPVERIRIRHTVQFADGQAFGGFDSAMLRAAAVPLPGSGGLLALSVALFGRYIRCRSRSRIPVQH